MNRQEIFDKVLEHLRKQGGLSLNEHGKCCYRGNHGNKCAIGVLIPDELYKSRMEYKTPSGLIKDEIIKLPSYFYKDKEYFLDKIQSKLHDGIKHELHYIPFGLALENRAKEFAEEYNLCYTSNTNNQPEWITE